MNIAIEKQDIIQWIKGLNDEKIIAKLVELKDKIEISKVEKQLINKGLKDIREGNISSDEDVRSRLNQRFRK